MPLRLLADLPSQPFISTYAGGIDMGAPLKKLDAVQAGVDAGQVYRQNAHKKDAAKAEELYQSDLEELSRIKGGDMFQANNAITRNAKAKVARMADDNSAEGSLRKSLQEQAKFREDISKSKTSSDIQSYINGRNESDFEGTYLNKTGTSYNTYATNSIIPTEQINAFKYANEEARGFLKDGWENSELRLSDGTDGLGEAGQWLVKKDTGSKWVKATDVSAFSTEGMQRSAAVTASMRQDAEVKAWTSYVEGLVDNKMSKEEAQEAGYEARRNGELEAATEANLEETRVAIAKSMGVKYSTKIDTKDITGKGNPEYARRYKGLAKKLKTETIAFIPTSNSASPNAEVVMGNLINSKESRDSALDLYDKEVATFASLEDNPLDIPDLIDRRRLGEEVYIPPSAEAAYDNAKKAEEKYLNATYVRKQKEKAGDWDWSTELKSVEEERRGSFFSKKYAISLTDKVFVEGEDMYNHIIHNVSGEDFFKTKLKEIEASLRKSNPTDVLDFTDVKAEVIARYDILAEKYMTKVIDGTTARTIPYTLKGLQPSAYVTRYENKVKESITKEGVGMYTATGKGNASQLLNESVGQNYQLSNLNAELIWETSSKGDFYQSISGTPTSAEDKKELRESSRNSGSDLITINAALPLPKEDIDELMQRNYRDGLGNLTSSKTEADNGRLAVGYGGNTFGYTTRLSPKYSMHDRLIKMEHPFQEDDMYLTVETRKNAPKLRGRNGTEVYVAQFNKGYAIYNIDGTPINNVKTTKGGVTNYVAEDDYKVLYTLLGFLEWSKLPKIDNTDEYLD